MSIRDELRESNHCKNCVYWKQLEEGKEKRGLCERFPPQVADAWVAYDDWCGEHVHNVKGKHAL